MNAHQYELDLYAKEMADQRRRSASFNEPDRCACAALPKELKQSKHAEWLDIVDLMRYFKVTSLRELQAAVYNRINGLNHKYSSLKKRYNQDVSTMAEKLRLVRKEVTRLEEQSNSPESSGILSNADDHDLVSSLTRRLENAYHDLDKYTEENKSLKKNCMRLQDKYRNDMTNNSLNTKSISAALGKQVKELNMIVNQRDKAIENLTVTKQRELDEARQEKIKLQIQLDMANTRLGYAQLELIKIQINSEADSKVPEPETSQESAIPSQTVAEELTAVDETHLSQEVSFSKNPEILKWENALLLQQLENQDKKLVELQRKEKVIEALNLGPQDVPHASPETKISISFQHEKPTQQSTPIRKRNFSAWEVLNYTDESTVPTNN